MDQTQDSAGLRERALWGIPEAVSKPSLSLDGLEAAGQGTWWDRTGRAGRFRNHPEEGGPVTGGLPVLGVRWPQDKVSDTP